VVPDEEESERQAMEDMEMDYAKTTLVIPSCSAWFDINSIHELEMQSLPEYFCGKFSHKNPHVYKAHRNYIIKLYRDNPNAYLSATVCRKNLSGDVCSTIRLHAFLEHWGLINFNVDPCLKPPKVHLSHSGAISPSVIDAASKGYLRIQEAEHIASYSQERTASDDLTLIAAKKINLIASKKRPGCNFCGNACGYHWYKKRSPLNSFDKKEEAILKLMGEDQSLHQTLKNLTQTYILCQECYNLGNFPKVLQAQDFEACTLESLLKGEKLDSKVLEVPLEVDPGEEPIEDPYPKWTLEETEALIDAISRRGDDWEAIARVDFKDQRSIHDILMHFLRLPISESMAIKFQENLAQKQHEPTSRYVTPTVFNDASNPLLSQLAIFAKCLETYQGEIDEKEAAAHHENDLQDKRTTRKQ